MSKKKIKDSQAEFFWGKHTKICGNGLQAVQHFCETAADVTRYRRGKGCWRMPKIRNTGRKCHPPSLDKQHCNDSCLASTCFVKY